MPWPRFGRWGTASPRLGYRHGGFPSLGGVKLPTYSLSYLDHIVKLDSNSSRSGRSEIAASSRRKFKNGESTAPATFGASARCRRIQSVSVAIATAPLLFCADRVWLRRKDI